MSYFSIIVVVTQLSAYAKIHRIHLRGVHFTLFHLISEHHWVLWKLSMLSGCVLGTLPNLSLSQCHVNWFPWTANLCPNWQYSQWRDTRRANSQQSPKANKVRGDGHTGITKPEFPEHLSLSFPLTPDLPPTRLHNPTRKVQRPPPL